MFIVVIQKAGPEAGLFWADGGGHCFGALGAIPSSAQDSRHSGHMQGSPLRPVLRGWLQEVGLKPVVRSFFFEALDVPWWLKNKQKIPTWVHS